LQSHPFPEIWKAATLDSYCGTGADFGETLWGRFLLDEAKSSARHAVEVLRQALELLNEESSLAAKYSPTFQSDISQAERFVEEAEKGWDFAAEAALQPLVKLGSAPRDYFDPDFRDRIKSMRDIWKNIYESIGETISESGSVHLEETRRIIPALRGLFTAAERYENEYRRLKTARNQVDFNDVSHAAISLLCDTAEGQPKPTEAAQLIGSRYAEVLIDEFQDTNGIQD
jgi:ATP-dependent helicase/nuclease subunit A